MTQEKARHNKPLQYFDFVFIFVFRFDDIMKFIPNTMLPDQMVFSAINSHFRFAKRSEQSPNCRHMQQIKSHFCAFFCEWSQVSTDLCTEYTDKKKERKKITIDTDFYK